MPYPSLITVSWPFTVCRLSTLDLGRWTGSILLIICYGSQRKGEGGPAAQARLLREEPLDVLTA